MKKIKLNQTASFPIGAVLGLTKQQAEPRSHVLKDEGKGVYVVLGKVQFKAGEEIGYEGELPPSIAVLVGEKAAAKSDSGNEPSVDEIKKTLTALKVEFPAKAKKAELLALLADAEKKAAEKAAAETDAKAAWNASAELQEEFPEVEDYIASLKQE